MTYEITRNNEFNSIEITFEGKPSAAIRDALKALRFRWHGQKKLWYGYADEETARAAIEGKTDAAKKEAETPARPVANKYGVQVGDLFAASWGYEQTNSDFFQVVELVGTSSVRVREVRPQIIAADPVSGMSEDRTYKISRELLPAAPFSVFIKDQERGDLKRLKSYAADGVSRPQFYLSSYADAYYCDPGEYRTYESWYH